MENILQTALADAVNSLASFFGTTTETIIEYAPEFLAKYGWYDTLNDIPLMAFIAFFITVAFCIGGAMFDVDLEHPILVVSCIFIICLIVTIGTKIITCIVAPEIVGVHAILELLKSTN